MEQTYSEQKPKIFFPNLDGLDKLLFFEIKR